jgi:D-serine deaminase-like pyridoxal phosphate-dependent protein
LCSKPIRNRDYNGKLIMMIQSNPSTPYLIVDMEAFEANLLAAETIVVPSRKKLRPHVKTHRCPDLAIKQIGLIATGLTCQTVGEAEGIAAVCPVEILISNEIVSPEKADRLAALAHTTRILVAVDSEKGLEILSIAAQSTGVTLGLLVDIDTGLNRCGVRSPEAAAQLAYQIAKTKGVHLAGVMGYEGRIRANEVNRAEKIKQSYLQLAAAKNQIEAAGLSVEIVSAGATSTLLDALESPFITEIQAGTYALMEDDLDKLSLPFQPAVSIATTVISTWGSRVVTDAGRRAMGCEYGLPICLDEHGKAVAANDEHLLLDWSGRMPSVGSIIFVRPSQNRTTFNLHQTVWLARKGTIYGSYPLLKGRS